MSSNEKLKVPIGGYIALIFALLYFSGIVPILSASLGWEWLNAFDFSKLQGTFATIGDTGANFTGKGGAGARQGFLFALSLLPGVMLALASVELVDYYGGLKAAQKLITPLLRPLLGLPGIVGLAFISSLQSTDAGASMTKALREEKHLTENERTVFGMFQFSGGAMIANLLSSGAAIYGITAVIEKVPAIIIISMGVILFFKILGANMMRLYVQKFGEEG